MSQKQNLKNVWDIVNKLKGKKTKSGFFIKDNQNLLITDVDLAEKFAINFQTISSDSTINPNILDNRKNTINNYIANHLNNKKIQKET